MSNRTNGTHLRSQLNVRETLQHLTRQNHLKSFHHAAKARAKASRPLCVYCYIAVATTREIAMRTLNLGMAQALCINSTEQRRSRTIAHTGYRCISITTEKVDLFCSFFLSFLVSIYFVPSTRFCFRMMGSVRVAVFSGGNQVLL